MNLLLTYNPLVNLLGLGRDGGEITSYEDDVSFNLFNSFSNIFFSNKSCTPLSETIDGGDILMLNVLSFPPLVPHNKKLSYDII